MLKVKAIARANSSIAGKSDGDVGEKEDSGEATCEGKSDRDSICTDLPYALVSQISDDNAAVTVVTCNPCWLSESAQR